MGQQCSFGSSTLYSPPDSPSRTSLPGETTALNYTREQAALRELFGAIRTGLVVSEAEFGVLPPGIATSAKVRLSVGNLAEAATEENCLGACTPTSRTDGVVESDVLETTLEGPGWAQGLHMTLSVRPVVGPFTGRNLFLSWSKNTLRAMGCKHGELNSRTIPEAFDDETEFFKSCLMLTYHTGPSASFNTAGVEKTGDTEISASERVMVPLKIAAYQTLISNLDAIPQGMIIPSRVQQLLYGSQGPVDVAIRPWPNTIATLFGTDPKMRVKSGILYAEFLCLLRARFYLSPLYSVKLYHNHVPILFSDSVSEKYKTIDCFVSDLSGHDSVHASYSSDVDMAPDPYATLVVSLAGYSTQNIRVNLQMTMNQFDLLMRESFSLKEDSFLFIVAEDDFTPCYTCYDNWKCVYSFALPDSSFAAGLKRSFRRLSLRRQRSTDMQPPQRRLHQEQLNEALIPHLDKVIQFLSSNARHFPTNLGQSDFEVEELRQMMPLYQLPLEQCGIHQHTITQVFEVTGPSIPIVFRVISAPSQESYSPLTATSTKQHDRSTNPSPSCTRLTNIMDINPNWPLCTFLRYVDAIVSPGEAVWRRRRLVMGRHSLEDWEGQPQLTLGELLRQWKPVWWPVEDQQRKLLTPKDIDPAQFLVVEKY